MRFLLTMGAGRVAVAVGALATLSAVSCGGRSRDGSAAAGSSGIAGASGGVENSGGSPAQGGQTSAGQTSGGSGAASSGGRSGTASSGGSSGAGGSSGNFEGWTLPHTSDRPWRQSVEPLCAPGGAGSPWDLWSDERGLYVLGETASSARGLYFNDGTGWSTLRQGQPDFFGLSGFTNGPLVLYAGGPCGVMFQDGDVDVCASTLPNIAGVFVVDPSRTFAIAGNRVFRYNGDYFTQYGKPLPQDNPSRPYDLWADAEVVIVASDQGYVCILPNADSEAEVLTLPGGAPALSLWAFGRDDIWVGLEGNQLAHYDGAAWTMHPLGASACGSVTAMWGTDHVLFFASPAFVGKIQDGEVHALASAPCSSDVAMPGSFEELQFRKIWGNSPNEVFFAVTERKIVVTPREETLESSSTAPDACGMQRLYWYDGTRIRPL